MHVTATVDSKRLNTALESFISHFPVEVMQSADDIAEKLEDEVKMTFHRERFAALSKDYSEWRKKHGLGTQPLYRTTAYYDAIEGKRVRFGGYVAHRPGRYPRFIRRSPSRTFRQIAFWHEYGAPGNNMPDRPVFKRTLPRARPIIFSEYRKAMYRTIALSGLK